MKPNIHELEALEGHAFSNRKEIVDAAQKLIDSGIEIVIISMGSDGAIVMDRNEKYKVDSWDVHGFVFADIFRHDFHKMIICISCLERQMTFHHI